MLILIFLWHGRATQSPVSDNIPDSKVHGAKMGPIWGRQDPDGPHVGPINFTVWDVAENYIMGLLRRRIYVHVCALWKRVFIFDIHEHFSKKL